MQIYKEFNIDIHHALQWKKQLLKHCEIENKGKPLVFNFSPISFVETTVQFNSNLHNLIQIFLQDSTLKIKQSTAKLQQIGKIKSYT